MKVIKFLLLSLILPCPLLLFGQTGEVAGKIVDAQTRQPLPFVHVFVGNTTLGTTSDTDGFFTLKNVPIGTHELVFSSIGYQTTHSKVTVAMAQTITLTIQLTEAQQQLSGVEVKSTRDKEWLKKMRLFEKNFFGEKFASRCKLVNPWVIDFVDLGNSNAFIAKASAPLEIVNNYLGYSVLFHLKNFQVTGQGYTIDGNAYFKELTEVSKIDTWAANRSLVYAGSATHLFKSILDNRATSEGFRLYIDKPGVVDVNTRTDLFYSEVNQKVVEYTTNNAVAPAGRPYEYTIQFNGRAEVHYLNKPGAVKYYKDMAGTVSWMEVRGNLVRVNNNGVLLNPGDIVYSGEWSNNRVGTMLPLNYQPLAPNHITQPIANHLAPIEKVYIHTDKPYYYPGENLWLKAYLNYSQPSSSDSLSKVLYLELINLGKEIVQQKVVRIDSGSAISDFKLPPDLPAGNYMLRGYTNWMRNFGEPCFSQKPIPVLNMSEKLERGTTYVTAIDSAILIVPSKESFQPREKIQLAIHIQDDNRLPAAANLSISITDEKQVVPVKEEETILQGISLPNLPKPALIAYPAEQGIMLSGIFKNDKQKPERTNLVAVVGKLDDFLLVDTDDQGRFTLNGLQFYDSVDFTFQAKDKRGKPYGHVDLIIKDAPPITALKAYKNLNKQDALSPQRVFTQFEVDKDATLLEEVTIKGSKIEEPPTELQHKIFGKPDYTVNGETLVNSGTTNLAVALQGKVPGMTIISAVGDKGPTYKISIRGSISSSINTSTDPLVLIDGIPVGGRAPVFENNKMVDAGDTFGDRIAMLDVSMIERIEVTTRVNSLYGEAGRHGVIAIFTKAGASNRLSHLQDVKTVDVYKVSGYSSSRTFKAPDYESPTTDKEKPDYRSTIYWNPKLVTDDSGTCHVSFFAADLPGRYRIIVEGITEYGKPFRAESFILVDNE